jgi:hypothetical protein
VSDIIKIKPIIALACDDARMENNGKPFLIGIYQNDAHFRGIVPPNADEIFNWSIHLWIPFQAEEIGTANFEIQIIGPNPKNVVVGKGRVILGNKPRETEITPLVLGPFHLKVWQNGEVKILFKNEDDKEFQTLRIIPVSFTAEELPDSNLSVASVIAQPS